MYGELYIYIITHRQDDDNDTISSFKKGQAVDIRGLPKGRRRDVELETSGTLILSG